MSGTALLVITIILLAIIGVVIGAFLVFAGRKFAVEVDPRESAVREALPGNNCGACGYPGCDGCAAAIAKGEAPVNACPVGGAPVADKISGIMGVEAGAIEKKVAFVRCAGTCDAAKRNGTYVGIPSCSAAQAVPGAGGKACQQGCLGFGECVQACEFDAIHVVNGVAVVNREKCVGCGKCAAACPQHLIDIMPDRSKYAVQCRNTEKGVLVKQQCDAGCLGCSLCVKQCHFDAISVTNNLAQIDYEKCRSCGLCAQKCPAKIITKRVG